MAAKAGKAIAAHVDYLAVGEGASASFGFTRQVLTGTVLGAGLGLLWKVRAVWLAPRGVAPSGRCVPIARVGEAISSCPKRAHAQRPGGRGGPRQPAVARAAGIPPCAALAQRFGVRRVGRLESVGVRAHTLRAQTWHWNEKRVIAQYYADLAKKEAKEEAERQAAIKAKFAALEAELLA